MALFSRFAMPIPHYLIITAILGVFLSARPAAAYEKLIERHCKQANVPPAIGLAIARQESGLRPLCINIEGEDFAPATRAEAEALIRKAAAKDQSYDVGLMQINSQWIKKWNLDPVSLLDPDTNVRAGIRILKQEIDRHGVNWKAVGAYHSPDPARAMRYANQVFGRMHGRAPGGMGGMISPRLELLVKRGIMTRAEARSIMANPRLNGPLRRKTLKALRARLGALEPRKSSELAKSRRDDE